MYPSIKLSVSIIAVIVLSACANTLQEQEKMMTTPLTTQPTTPMPDYVVINNDQCPEFKRNMLRTPSAEITFPISHDIRQMIEQLVAKYDQEKNCAGLAAPQIGFPIQAIVFAVEDTPKMKKWRPDLEGGLPKTIWLNPSYEPVEDKRHIDYEGCFSIDKLACQVARYYHIRYTACTINGDKVVGEAKGYLARVIQHEIDHIRGILCIDCAIPGSIMERDKYIQMRKDAEADRVKRALDGDHTMVSDVTN